MSVFWGEKMGRDIAILPALLLSFVLRVFLVTY